jgi:hypothetical protein
MLNRAKAGIRRKGSSRVLYEIVYKKIYCLKQQKQQGTLVPFLNSL